MGLSLGHQGKCLALCNTNISYSLTQACSLQTQVYVQWGLTTLAALLTLAYSGVSSLVAWHGAAAKTSQDDSKQPLLKHAHPMPSWWQLMVCSLASLGIGQNSALSCLFAVSYFSSADLNSRGTHLSTTAWSISDICKIGACWSAVGNKQVECVLCLEYLLQDDENLLHFSCSSSCTHVARHQK